MPNITDINTAVYMLLHADQTLAGLCTVYKGGKRPSLVTNPSVTVEANRLEPGEGEGIWMCDITVTVYTDNLANGMPDHERLDTIVSRIYQVLEDAETDIDNAQTLPLVRGDISGLNWKSAHEAEISQECVFGLVFIQYS
ncbi:hypothetical protein ACFL30_00925 [Candidatus Latescibacterota bacterium]